MSDRPFPGSVKKPLKINYWKLLLEALSLMAVILFLALISGCEQNFYENGDLTEDGEKMAAFLCGRHGGVDKANVFVLGDGAHVHCKDGSVWDIDSDKQVNGPDL